MSTAGKNRCRLLLLLLAEASMILLESCVLWDCWKSSGTSMFRYYTQDSNILALIATLVSVPLTLRALFSGNSRPAWLKSLRLVAVSGLMLTFLVSAFVLTPINSGASLKRYSMEFQSMMLKPPILYLHTLCPLLMCFTFLFLESSLVLPCFHSLFILPPTILYGAVTLYKNYTFAYIGPYPFFHVYRQPTHMTILWCALILLGSWLISLGLCDISRRISRRRASSPK